MSDIIQIFGKVRYSITLDPGVWIFDDRKFLLKDFFTDGFDPSRSGEPIREGNIAPTTESEKRFGEKKSLATDSFVIPLNPFLNNAEPENDANEVILHIEMDETRVISLEDAKRSVLCFAINGKPITETGPAHLYFGDLSNREQPIQRIRAIEVR